MDHLLARGEDSETAARTSRNWCTAQGTRRTPSCLYPNSCAASSSNAANDGCRSASTRTTNRSPSSSPPPHTNTGTRSEKLNRRISSFFMALLPSRARSEKLNRRISSFFMALPLPPSRAWSGEKLNCRKSCFIVVDVSYDVVELMHLPT
jgi:hypothetical protein